MSRPEEEYLLEALQSESILRACLFRYTRNAADVDELLQETYARLLSSPELMSGAVRSVRAFALTTARNVALDWLRHRSVVPLELVSDLAALEVMDERAQVEEIVNAHQELTLLMEVVADLPTRWRRAFVLRRVFGLSQKEVARTLGVSEGTVEQLLARGMRRFADRIFAKQSDLSFSTTLRKRLRMRGSKDD